MNQGKNTVGVIVGRFQVDVPHVGHINLVHQVRQRHGKVLIVLGSTGNRLTMRDPLDYATRAAMMSSAFPDVTLAHILDQRYDSVWSKNLDALVKGIFPTDTATLYGSRDSFLNHYEGGLNTQEIEGLNFPSGTELREYIAQQVVDSPDFRKGIIFACANRYPISYQCVDVAILNEDKTKVLLGQKEGEEQYRFIGGFVDSADTSLESCVRREVAEETSVEIGDIKYIGSYRINDWRFKEGHDKLMSAFFTAKYIYGRAKAEDDIASCEWVDLKDDGRWPRDILLPEHRSLGAKLITELYTLPKDKRNKK